MRKAIVMAAAMMLVFAAAAAAEMGCRDHAEMEGDKHSGTAGDEDCIMKLDADYSVKETADGAVITIKAKKGGAEAKAIQEKVKKCVEMCAAKKSGKDVAAAGDDETVVCPVMGTRMKKSKAFETAEYKGRTYYFCCGGCKEPFLKNPEKYIKN